MSGTVGSSFEDNWGCRRDQQSKQQIQQIPQVQPVILKQEGHKVAEPPAAGRKDYFITTCRMFEICVLKKNKICYLKIFVQYILIMLFPLRQVLPYLCFPTHPISGLFLCLFLKIK